MMEMGMMDLGTMESGMAGTVMGWMSTGGWVMWILLLFSGAALSVAAERAIVLGRALVVAVPTQLAFNALQGWALRLEGDLEGVANTLLEMKA